MFICFDALRDWSPRAQAGRAAAPKLGESTHECAANIRIWIEQALQAGFKSVICLLTQPEITRHGRPPAGLLDAYAKAGLQPVHIPLSPEIGPQLLLSDSQQIERAYDALPKPVLVHCHAGIVRSGAALRHLTARAKQNSR